MERLILGVVESFQTSINRTCSGRTLFWMVEARFLGTIMKIPGIKFACAIPPRIVTHQPRGTILAALMSTKIFTYLRGTAMQLQLVVTFTNRTVLAISTSTSHHTCYIRMRTWFTLSPVTMHSCTMDQTRDLLNSAPSAV